jgi:hypothetical protein
MAPGLSIPVGLRDDMETFARHLKVAEIALAGTMAAGSSNGDYQDAIVIFLQELQAEFDRILAGVTPTECKEA